MCRFVEGQTAVVTSRVLEPTHYLKLSVTEISKVIDGEPVAQPGTVL